MYTFFCGHKFAVPFGIYLTVKLLGHIVTCGGFPGGSSVKKSVCQAGDVGLISGSGRSPREGNDNPLQYSCLDNPMDKGTCWAAVHRVVKESDKT